MDARLPADVGLERVRGLGDRAGEVRALLDRAFGGGFSDDDWAHCLGGEHVVLTEAGVVVAHAAVVPRTLALGGRPLEVGYVEGVAAVPPGRGHGSAVMAEVAAVLREQGVPGFLSTGEHGFYERLGWRRWQGRTFVGEHRTPDEDDGVMVLPALALDLTADLACEPRSGDAW